MQTQSYLLFQHRDSRYGIAADQVRELFPLPMLTPLADAPQDMIGSLNWRGKLLPVMHLDLRLGQTMAPCKITDSVIVMEWQGIQVGMVVNQVLGVQALEAGEIEAAPTYGREQQINTAFLVGLAKQEDTLIMLLKPETLIRQPDQVATRIWEAELFENAAEPEPKVGLEISTSGEPHLSLDQQTEWQQDVVANRTLTNFFELYCAQPSAREQAVFRRRADELRVPLETTDLSEQLPLAVIGWGDELFGVELGLVREFINIGQITAIPCCPSHILGNMNLRGEVMTLVDICPALELPTQMSTSQAKAIVVEVDEVVAGLPVDEVLDVAYISPTEIADVPTTVGAGHKGFVQGIAKYQEIPLNILNLSTILSKGNLMVNQAI